MRRRWFRRLWFPAILLLVLALAAPWLAGIYWSVRSSNPVRRGVRRATELGCFSCHGHLGTQGLPDPGKPSEDVPTWSGGVWMMYVRTDEDIRAMILDGSHEHEEPPSGERPAIEMPAFRDVLRGTDLEDLVAAFKVLSGMSLPPADSAARRGHDLARRWRCFSCHGPAGSGGLPNPGSLAGFVPGWYGPDFEDLVRDRAEFEGWVLEGSIPRLREGWIAPRFLRRQRLPMPAYRTMTRDELEELWAYVTWLAQTRGGFEGVGPSW
jgi:cytochrome c553